jgi:hypothetical protein
LAALGAAAPIFDVKPLRGIDFILQNSPTPRKFLIETMPGGVALFDYNNDGLLDIFLVSGGKITEPLRVPENFDRSDPNRGVEAIGMSESIRRFQKISLEWKSGDDVTVSRRLVAVEASDSMASHFVGPPIATISIDKRGARWIDRGLCDWNPTQTH